MQNWMHFIVTDTSQLWSGGLPLSTRNDLRGSSTKAEAVCLGAGRVAGATRLRLSKRTRYDDALLRVHDDRGLRGPGSACVIGRPHEGMRACWSHDDVHGIDRPRRSSTTSRGSSRLRHASKLQWDLRLKRP